MRPLYRLASQLLLSLAIGAFFTACNRSPESKTLRSDTAHGDIFTERSLNVAYAAVDSIFQSRCVECHSGREPAQGVDLSSYESVMRGREGGPIVQVGNPGGSVLIDAMRGKGDRPAHVRASNRFTNADLATVASWIAEGAQPQGSQQERLTATMRLYVVALSEAQKDYYTSRKRYAASVDALRLIPVTGVNISFVQADTGRWEATVTHPELSEICVVGGRAREQRQQVDLAAAAQLCSPAR